MEHWEFLIQKEGDRSWLPLETPDVEILEGRYRVVARSSRFNTPIEIRITHQTAEEFPPKRRVQKRTNRTNPEGLMVVIPFMRFKPGCWEMLCFGEMSADDSEFWQESVRLQVLPIDRDLEVDDDLEPAQPPTVIAQTATTLQSTQNPDESEATATRSDRIAEPTPGSTTPTDANTPVPESRDRPPEQVQEVESSQPPPNGQTFQVAPAVKLILESQTYVVNSGEQFTLSGRIEPDTTSQGQFVVTGQLHIGLRNPQNGKLLAFVEQELSSQILPVPFSCSVDIPLQCNTNLILGEVKLYPETASGEENSSVELASASFSITADITQLMEEISDELNEQQLLEFSRESAIKNNLATIDNAFLNIVETLKNPEPLSFERVKKPAIPPKIDLPNPASQPTPLQSVEFPFLSRLQKFSTQQQETQKSPVEQTDPDEEETLEATESPEEASNVIDFAKKIQARTQQKDRLAETPAPDPVAEVPEQPIPFRNPSSPLDLAFQKLNLQERFLSRLNSLAGDDELSEWLKTHSSELPVAQPEPEEPEEAEELMDWEDREIVVDDELESEESIAISLFDRDENADRSSTGLVLPENEPVPTPHLQLPRGKLTAGRQVKLVVQLPELKPRIYVKLWVHDRQTRTLLDGPHWITDFWATGMGDMEATMQLLIPYGTVEIQLDAIAVEMHTEREGHKVTVSAPVAPPTSPSLPLDNG